MDVLVIVAVGLGVGAMYGVFGAGGSAFATPVLALLGVPAPLAVASPLPAMLPASIAGAHQYCRAGLVDRRIATRAVAAGIPAAVAGAALARVVGGDALLALSGVLLLGAGVRMVVPPRARATRQATSASTAKLVALVAAAAFLSGLLANGGGFLLVPVFVVVLGLSTARAAGTSLVTVAALIVPTLAAHAWVGDIDWVIAGAFALGAIPASVMGARTGPRLHEATARRAFGVTLVAFALWFLVTRAL